MGRKKNGNSAEEIQREVRCGRHYRAYKILLRADRFTTAQGFADYWKLASSIAGDLGVSTQASAGYDGHEQRVVSFWAIHAEKGFGGSRKGYTVTANYRW